MRTGLRENSCEKSGGENRCDNTTKNDCGMKVTVATAIRVLQGVMTASLSYQGQEDATEGTGAGRKQVASPGPVPSRGQGTSRKRRGTG